VGEKIPKSWQVQGAGEREDNRCFRGKELSKNFRPTQQLGNDGFYGISRRKKSIAEDEERWPGNVEYGGH